jgi:hypothetical protein
MAQTVFVPNPAAWHHAFRSWQGMTGRYIYRKTLEATAFAIAEAPGPGKPTRNRTGLNYSTGHLQSMIRPMRGKWGTKELEGRVVAIPKHAIYVHNGTRPHTIIPTRAPLLVFFWAKMGRVVTFGKVNHPGTVENPFLARALKRAI